MKDLLKMYFISNKHYFINLLLIFYYLQSVSFIIPSFFHLQYSISLDLFSLSVFPSHMVHCCLISHLLVQLH